MENDPTLADELARLHAIGEWMRDVGAIEFSHGDLHIKLAPRPKAASPANTAPIEPSPEEKDDEGIDDEEREHRKKWRRITRSSGSGIPPFKPTRTKS